MADLWLLLQEVVERGAPAWPALIAALEPELVAMARRQPIGRLRDHDDSPREIVTRVLARLHARDYAAIRKLCTLEPRPELRAWLRVLVRRSAIDYMRESPEYERGNAARDDRWISLATLSSRVHQPVDTLGQKRTEVVAYLRDTVEKAQAEAREHGDDAVGRLALAWKVEPIHARRVVARGDMYLRVLASVLEGHSYPETAERLGISRREVELTVRYIEDLLKARGFAPGAER